MRYEWLDEYCLLKKGTVIDYKREWEATRYMVDGRMFAMRGEDRSGRKIVTIKVSPPHGEILRGEYKDIIPGYYMNKQHWCSVYMDGDVPGAVVKAMLDEGYKLIIASLSKARQCELSEEN